MSRETAIKVVKSYMGRYEENTFDEIGSGEYWDSGNYDDAFEYGCKVGRIRALIEVFGIEEGEIILTEGE